MPWVLMTAPSGKGMLVNLDVCLAFAEDETGNAIAIGIGGGTIATGEKFQVVVDDMTADEDEGGPVNDLKR